jgi:3-hydroxyacyl-CoA dehydrogenase/3a,7a,12a-trihydroxy-5b-cholest-24-enoyl-CoA hydratase
MFLKKIDPKRGAEVVAKLRGAGGAATAAAAPKASAPAAPKAATQAPAIMKALAERLSKSPNLAKEVGAKVGVKVGSSSWLLDLTGAGTVAEGDVSSAAAVLTMEDETMAELAKSGALRDLYMHGQVRIDGDPRVASKITFFKGLVSG